MESEAHVSGTERRASPRQPVILQVTFGEGAELESTENVSAEGLFIRTERSFAIGERLVLQVSFPPLLSPVNLDVEVVRRRLPAEGKPGGIGVRLANSADPLGRAILKRLCDLFDKARSPEPKHHLLVVDDSVLLQQMYSDALSALLGEQAFSIEIVSNGQEALDRLARTPRIELVICDLAMPVLDGFELIERIRKDPANSSLPVVAISATGDTAVYRARNVGANTALKKPVDFVHLVQTIKALLSL